MSKRQCIRSTYFPTDVWENIQQMAHDMENAERVRNRFRPTLHAIRSLSVWLGYRDWESIDDNCPSCGESQDDMDCGFLEVEPSEPAMFIVFNDITAENNEPLANRQDRWPCNYDDAGALHRDQHLGRSWVCAGCQSHKIF